MSKKIESMKCEACRFPPTVITSELGPLFQCQTEGCVCSYYDFQFRGTWDFIQAAILAARKRDFKAGLKWAIKESRTEDVIENGEFKRYSFIPTDVLLDEIFQDYLKAPK